VPQALGHGRIDGQKAAFGDTHWLQRFTPRSTRSKWSQVNTEKATATAGGQADAARGPGRGGGGRALGSRVRAAEPGHGTEDLQRALDANPAARAFFATLAGPNRYAVLYRISEAKRPETRARRIAKFVQMLAEGRTLY
jgi:uncharacterized protein YdeI (YjbR/CyaY-like superfamily)